MMQVPDIFLELFEVPDKVDRKHDRRTHVLRVNHTVVGTVGNMLWSCAKLEPTQTSAKLEQAQIAATWVRWARDQCLDVEKSVGVDCDPRFLMAIGIDSPQMANRNLKTALAYQNSDRIDYSSLNRFPKRLRLHSLEWKEGTTRAQQVLHRLRSAAEGYMSPRVERGMTHTVKCQKCGVQVHRASLSSLFLGGYIWSLSQGQAPYSCADSQLSASRRVHHGRCVARAHIVCAVSAAAPLC
jgi:hypothetical protein